MKKSELLREAPRSRWIIRFTILSPILITIVGLHNGVPLGLKTALMAFILHVAGGSTTTAGRVKPSTNTMDPMGADK